jgi:hypothetical protein
MVLQLLQQLGLGLVPDSYNQFKPKLIPVC